TQDFLGGPIIKQMDSPTIHNFTQLNQPIIHSIGAYEDNSTEPSQGVQIGRIINAILLCGLLLYFCLVR
ncbi:hypothetical protein, partial [Sphingobium baderi]